MWHMQQPGTSVPVDGRVGNLAHPVHRPLVRRTGKRQSEEPVSLIVGRIAVLLLIPPRRGLLTLVLDPLFRNPAGMVYPAFCASSAKWPA
jgi:hypothetical protein